MSYETIRLEVKNKIAYLTIDQPKALNALSSQVLKEIAKAADEIHENDDVKVVIVTGEGEKSFVAGANIKEMQKLNAIEGRDFSDIGNTAFEKIANLPQPTIAAVNGFALGGGCELAISCDIRLASDNAVFGQPEVGLGITPGFGGTQRLPRLIPTGIAKELIYTGRNVKAEEAKTIGLVNHVYSQDDLMEEAEKLANKMLGNGQLAVQKAKKAIDVGLDSSLQRGLDMEREVFGILFSTEDQKEGMQAFIDKRKPEFKTK